MKRRVLGKSKPPSPEKVVCNKARECGTACPHSTPHEHIKSCELETCSKLGANRECACIPVTTVKRDE